MTWKAAATFDTLAAAELAKSTLERHGIPTLLVNDRTAPLLAIDSAGPKLMVDEIDFDRARAILERTVNRPPTDEEIAAAIAEQPDSAGLDLRSPEPIVENPTDRQVMRLVIVTVFGLLFLSADFFAPPGAIVVFNLPIVRLLAFPFHLYALYLAWTLRRATPPVCKADYWKIALALACNIMIWMAVVTPLAHVVNVFHDPLMPGWRNERFGGLGDVALTIDLPGTYTYDLRDNKTVLGLAKMRAFVVSFKGQEFVVSIESLDKADTPEDPVEAAERYVKQQFPADSFWVESKKPATLGVYRGIEIVVRFTEKLTNQPRVARERVFLVDRHIVFLLANLPADQLDSPVADRFFRSARLQ